MANSKTTGIQQAGPRLRPKMAEPNLQLDVDLMILDYAVDMAIHAALKEHRARLDGVEDSLESAFESTIKVVDSFLPIFKAQHPDHVLEKGIRLRLAHLKFTALYTRRHTKSSSTPSPITLQKLRDGNLTRAREWMSRQGPTKVSLLTSIKPAILISEGQASGYRRHMLRNLGLSTKNAHYGTKNCVSLLDLLPIFVDLSAKTTALKEDSTINDAWMQLASDFMHLSVAEQHLIFGSEDSTPFQQAFSWGATAGAPSSGTSDAAVVERMFQNGIDGASMQQWSRTRQRIVREMADHHDSLAPYLISERDRISVRNFENRILIFLHGVLDNIPRPILTQLEAGKLEEFSADETRAMMARAGLA